MSYETASPLRGRKDNKQTCLTVRQEKVKDGASGKCPKQEKSKSGASGKCPKQEKPKSGASGKCPEQEKSKRWPNSRNRNGSVKSFV